MDVVCEVCGSVGFKHLLVQCSKCKNSTRHRYCMDIIVYGGPLIEWLCDDCLPKHNKLMESLEVFSNQRQPNHIQLDSSKINESDVDRGEVRKELLSWRHRGHRSRKGKRDSKHFLNGGTFNSFKKFVGKMSEHNDVDKVVESKNYHLVDSLESADGPNQSVSNPTSETRDRINVQKMMVGFEPTMNSLEGLDLSKEKDSCVPPKHAEESIPQGTKADLFPSTNDIERCHPFATDDLCPISPSVKRTDGSSHMLESAEQPHPLEVVNPDGSSHSALGAALETKVVDLENSVRGFGSAMNSMEWLDLPKKKDSCNSSSKNSAGSIPQGTITCLYPSIYDVERSYPSPTDGSSSSIPSEEQVGGSSPTLESWKQPPPLAVIYPSDNTPRGIQRSKSPSYHSQPVQGSDQNIQNDPLVPSKEFKDSRSMSKAIGPSCSSNGQGSSTFEKDGPDGKKFLLHSKFITPALDNLMESTLSMAKDCLLSNADNSDESNISDNHLLCTAENREQGQSLVMSQQIILSGEAHCIGNCLKERTDSWEVNESSSPKSAPMGNQRGRSVQNDVQNTSVHVDKNVVCRQVSQVEGVKSEELPAETSSPSKATESCSEKQHNRPDRHSRHLAENQKSKTIKKTRNADPAQLKSGRSSKQLDYTYPSASLGLSSKTSSKTKDVGDVNSNGCRTSENVMPKKRKGPALPYNKDEDAEAMQAEDLNQSCENYGQVKKNRTRAENGVMNPTSSVENRAEALRPGISNHQYVNNHAQAKKQKSIDANDDGNALLGDPNGGSARNDDAQSASQDVDAAEHGSLSRMPDISAPTDQHCDISTQPIEKPYWTGIMKIGQEYISLAAHLSNQACKKVQESSRSLPPVMKVTQHSKLEAWPSIWEESEPTAESIGLYFFSDNMRPNKDLDRLVQYVTDHTIVLKYVVGFVKLLIFPSVFLPEQSQIFQGKHYLWGVFRRRKARSKGDLPGRKQDGTPQVAKKRSDRQGKVQDDTMDQEKPVSSKHIILNDNQPSPGKVTGPRTETKPCDDKKARFSSEAPTPNVYGLFKGQAPKSEYYIRELEKEGALVVTENRLAKPGPIRL